MGDYAGKARELVAKAEKRLKAFSLFGASSKYEDAAEMLERAANQFKLAKACESTRPPSLLCPDAQQCFSASSARHDH